ncbi:hypothetical protein [Synechococcus sp. NOUM97013]|uniref:hypothetical protein n=1 Tax=Synechococcus sp. NOUM97013 TaxID=1442555 RepID=UPI001648457B|nr:hypothetical protein [Synechococcus sp. NOUM97013]QNI73644.1 hypothetical protein SynNOUM97013_01586 [Synechococcus sp. NOUM97013]
MSPPSFVIAGAGGNASLTPRWDRVDSRTLIALARKIYFQHLSESGQSLEPCGVVVNIQHNDGRVVFEAPTLLPDEQFISADLIGRRLRRPRQLKDRLRGAGM